MRAIILFLTLISNLTLAQEPSEVAEIRKIYQKTKEEIKTTQNSLKFNYQYPAMKEEQQYFTNAEFKAYFSDSNQKDLKLITASYQSFYGFLNLEYLYSQDELTFAYSSTLWEGSPNGYELRCYFQKQNLIHFKELWTNLDEGNSGFEEKNPQKLCLDLKDKAKNLKNSLSSLTQNAN